MEHSVSWMGLTIASAVLLGIYDLAKKLSVRGNATAIVLLCSVSLGSLIWAVMLLAQSFLSANAVDGWLPSILRVQSIGVGQHVALFAKSVLVGSSWMLAFESLRRLPLSIAAPIRSTSPVWTLLIAIGFLGERPAILQWVGIVIVLVAFWGLSIAGRKEGISFKNDPAVWMMIAATLLGAISSIYDKILLQQYSLSPATVQAWFSVYLFPVVLPMGWRQWRSKESKDRFEFRWIILAISPLLLAADMFYFSALADPDAMVSIVSPLRRCSVIVAFVLSSRMRGEVNLHRKLICVLGILLGVAIIMRG